MGTLKLPLEEIYHGGNSKSRNPHMQTILRMTGFGDNAGSGFTLILSVWEENGWVRLKLIENTDLDQVTLYLTMEKDENVIEEPGNVIEKIKILLPEYSKKKLEKATVIIQMISEDKEHFGEDRVSLPNLVGCFRDVVEQRVRIWNKGLEFVKKKENAVYELKFWEKEIPCKDKGLLFSNFDKAYQKMLEERRYYDSNPGLSHVETVAEIICIELDSENEISSHMYFNSKLQMINLIIDPGLYEKLGEIYNMDIDTEAYVHIPIPFHKGDIVKVVSPIEATYYGVIPSEFPDRENDDTLQYGDASDMVVSLDIYNDEFEFDYTDDTCIQNLEYCPEDNLPEDQRILQKLSEARKNDNRMYELLCEFSKK